MIRNISLINVNGRFRLQGQSLSKEDLILLFNLHGYAIEMNLSSIQFYNVSLEILCKIPESLLNQSLTHITEMLPEERVYYSSLASNKLAMVDSLGKN